MTQIVTPAENFAGHAVRDAKEELPTMLGFAHLGATRAGDSTNKRGPVEMIQVKCFTRDPGIIPSIIPVVERQPQYEIDVANQDQAVELGVDVMDTVPGRYRPGRVDTGVNCIKVGKPVTFDLLQLVTAGFHFTRVERWEQTKNNARGKPVTTHVVCAIFERKEPAHNIMLPALLRTMMELMETVWGNCLAWDNPNRITTLNFTEPFQPGQAPKRRLLVKDKKIIVETVAAT